MYIFKVNLRYVHLFEYTNVHLSTFMYIYVH